MRRHLFCVSTGILIYVHLSWERKGNEGSQRKDGVAKIKQTFLLNKRIHQGGLASQRKLLPIRKVHEGPLGSHDGSFPSLDSATVHLTGKWARPSTECGREHTSICCCWCQQKICRREQSTSYQPFCSDVVFTFATIVGNSALRCFVSDA